MKPLVVSVAEPPATTQGDYPHSLRSTKILSELSKDEKEYTHDLMSVAKQIYFPASNPWVILKNNISKVYITKSDRKTLEPEIDLFGTTFDYIIEKQDDHEMYHLSHKQWPLSGMGVSMTEAILDLKLEAKYLLEYYLLDKSQLDESTFDFINFLSTLIKNFDV